MLCLNFKRKNLKLNPFLIGGFDKFHLKMTLEEVFVSIEERFPQYWNLRNCVKCNGTMIGHSSSVDCDYAQYRLRDDLIDLKKEIYASDSFKNAKQILMDRRNECDVCGNLYVRRSRMEDHMRRRHEMCECKLCGKLIGKS